MVKEIKGPWGVILIGPAASNTPYKPWDRNQGTYLAMALAIPLFLTLFATIGIPIIPGAYTVKVVAAGEVGRVAYGTWGTCLAGKGIDGVVVDNCTPWSVLGGNETLLAMPQQLWNLTVPINKIDNVIPGEFQLANGILHAIAVTGAWLASTVALAASGEWHMKRQTAWDFNRYAWGMEMISMISCIVPWALEIAMFAKIKSYAKMSGDQASLVAHVSPGPTIFLLSAALFTHFVLALVRFFWSKKEPRPTWTLEAAGDFHSAPPANTGMHGDRRGSGLAPLAVPPYGQGMGGRGMGMPNSAGLPDNGEQPPAWENLNLDTATYGKDEKYWPPAELDEAVSRSAQVVPTPTYQEAQAQAQAQTLAQPQAQMQQQQM